LRCKDATCNPTLSCVELRARLIQETYRLEINSLHSQLRPLFKLLQAPEILQAKDLIDSDLRFLELGKKIIMKTTMLETFREGNCQQDHDVLQLDSKRRKKRGVFQGTQNTRWRYHPSLFERVLRSEDYADLIRNLHVTTTLPLII